MKIQDVARSSGIGLVHRGGLYLVSGVDVEIMINSIVEMGGIIYGIEGFEISGEKISPVFDAIADFSGVYSAEESRIQALEFVKQSNKRYYFDFSI